MSAYVAVGYVRLVSDVAVGRYGWALPELLARGGLCTEDLEDPEAMVPSECVFDMTRALLEQCRDPSLGLRMADAFDLRTKMSSGRAMPSSETLAGRVSRHLRYESLRGLTEFSLRVEGPFAIADVVPVGIPTDLLPVFFDYGVAATCLRHRGDVASPRTEISAWLSYPEQPHHSELRELIGGVLFFEAPFNRLRFRADDLRVALDADRKTGALSTGARAERLANDAAAAERELLTRLHACLASRLATDPSLERIARELGAGARTLQRQLNALGTSFLEELETARRGRACELLRETDHGIERIAAALGYGDASNFRRAFRRWTGVSPSVFRAGGFLDARAVEGIRPRSRVGRLPVTGRRPEARRR